MRLPAEIPRTTALTVAVFVSLVLGIGDYLTGPLFSFTIFYLAPVALVAWYVGPRAAMGVALLCVALWSVSEVEAFGRYAPLYVDVWNAIVRAAFFLLLVALLSEVRATLDHENRTAREFQRALLPRRLDGVPGLDVAFAYRPTRVLSGDYFDVVPGPDGAVTVCVGDVAGKGAGPALLMANLQAAVRVLVPLGTSPAAMCRRLNDLLVVNSLDSRFVTLFVATIDARRERLTWSNAGHPPALLLEQDGAVRPLGPTGMVLGIHPQASILEETLALPRGSRLVLYTDGVSEARSADGREFGEDRLVDACRSARAANVNALRDELVGAVERFGHGPLEDDLTLAVIET